MEHSTYRLKVTGFDIATRAKLTTTQIGTLGAFLDSAVIHNKEFEITDPKLASNSISLIAPFVRKALGECSSLSPHITYPSCILIESELNNPITLQVQMSIRNAPNIATIYFSVSRINS